MTISLSRRRAVGLMALLAAYPLASAVRPASANDVPLAIKGYDPVAYFTDGKPARGLPEIEYEWDEHRYRFSQRGAPRSLQGRSGALRAAVREFLRDGAEPRAKSSRPNPENWLISDGKL